MEPKEEFSRLVKGKAEHEAKIVELEARLRALKSRTLELENEATKAEVLEEHGMKRKREAVEENKRAIAEAEADLPKHRAAVGIIADELKKLENDTLDSLKPKYRELYGKALREFYELLKKALEKELGLREFQQQTEREVRALGISPHRQSGYLFEPTGTCLPVLFEEWPAADRPFLLETFIARCKMNGYDLE
jgi:uncharacterized coiled-coil protein SlyX